MSNQLSSTENASKALPQLRFEQIAKSYGSTPVLRDLSLSLFPGEVVGLLGPNGAGKTTAFYIAVGLIAPDRGKVYFSGEEVTHVPMHKRAKMGMGYLSQEPSIFRGLTVRENVLAILELQPLSKQEKKERLEQLLEELHLTALADKPAVALSGGERRRLEVTRALVTDPSCLMLDEPFANIDPLSIDEVKQLVRHLAERGISVLITDHNAREIFSTVDRSYLICDGTVLASGAVDELLANEEVRRRYLGLTFSL